MMRTLLPGTAAAFLVMALAAVSGCGSTTTPADNSPPSESGHYEGDGHDHSGDEAGHLAGDGHDHDGESAQVHPTEGPHGGHLVELGNEEYHAELLHDEITHTVTVHLLDAAGTQPVALSQPEITLQLFQDGQFVKYALKAIPAPDATAGTASQFAIVDEALCDALVHGDETRGRLQVTINGKPYTGTIEHSSHDEHEQDEH